MLLRWTVLGLLCFAPACADAPEICTKLPKCGATGLGPIASPTSAADERYNRVLQLLQEDLHRAVGRYIDGSLPAYAPTASPRMALLSSRSRQLADAAALARTAIRANTTASRCSYYARGRPLVLFEAFSVGLC